MMKAFDLITWIVIIVTVVIVVYTLFFRGG